MSNAENDLDRTAKLFKNALYLLGLIAAAFIGGISATKFAGPIVSTPQQVMELQAQLDDIKGDVAELLELDAKVGVIATELDTWTSESDIRVTRFETIEARIEANNTEILNACAEDCIGGFSERLDSMAGRLADVTSQLSQTVRFGQKVQLVGSDGGFPLFTWSDNAISNSRHNEDAAEDQYWIIGN